MWCLSSITDSLCLSSIPFPCMDSELAFMINCVTKRRNVPCFIMGHCNNKPTLIICFLQNYIDSLKLVQSVTRRGKTFTGLTLDICIFTNNYFSATCLFLISSFIYFEFEILKKKTIIIGFKKIFPYAVYKNEIQHMHAYAGVDEYLKHKQNVQNSLLNNKI